MIAFLIILNGSFLGVHFDMHEDIVPFAAFMLYSFPRPCLLHELAL